MTPAELVDECAVSNNCSVLYLIHPPAPIWITTTNLYPVAVNYLRFGSSNQLDLIIKYN